jgi:hypothetical protein
VCAEGTGGNRARERERDELVERERRPRQAATTRRRHARRGAPPPPPPPSSSSARMPRRAPRAHATPAQTSALDRRASPSAGPCKASRCAALRARCSVCTSPLAHGAPTAAKREFEMLEMAAAPAARSETAPDNSRREGARRRHGKRGGERGGGAARHAARQVQRSGAQPRQLCRPQRHLPCLHSDCSRASLHVAPR